MEEEWNPAPKNYRPTWALKVAFLCLASFGILAYGYMIIERRSAQKRFLESNQMAAIKLVETAVPNIKVTDPKTDLAVNFYEHIGQKWILLNIWATWCPPCQEEMPSIELLQQQLKDKLNIIALSVDDDIQMVKEFIKTHNPSFTIFWDQEKNISKKLGLSKYPETFLISPDGVLRIQFSGPRDWASKMAVDYLLKAMNQSSP